MSVKVLTVIGFSHFEPPWNLCDFTETVIYIMFVVTFHQEHTIMIPIDTTSLKE